MEDKKSEKHEQGNELMDLLNEINIHQDEEGKTSNNELEGIDDTILDDEKPNEVYVDSKEINVLNLPPRKQVHSQNNRRTNLKISRPFIRLAIVGVLLLFVITLLFYYGNGIGNF